MTLGPFHVLDVAVILTYLGAVLWFGWRSSHQSASEEGFFLAGRKLGKLYQFFLSFGNATEPQGAVSTASLVLQRGVTGVWFSFQTVFMNPYFWFMNTWFRRVRLVTLADMFEDRLGSRGLSRFYALFQVFVACALLGFGNFVAYKIASSITLKPESQWSAADHASVDGYVELKRLEQKAAASTLPPESRPQLDALRDRHARGELHSYITVLPSLPFYIVFAVVIGAYMILGGMAAAALNEALQGVLIVVFSILLLPTGLQAIGGWSQLKERVPREMFDLFGGSGGSPLFIFAVLFAGLVQIHGLSHNMGIYGSAQNEFAARFGGVSGAYMKRIMIVLWAFAGLIAIALFGPGGLADPDAAWGVMTNRLLGPGFIGLMLAGILAGTMSTLAAKALAIASLFVRNFWRHLRPETTQAESVRAARWTIFSVLALGVVSAEAMNDVETLVKLVLTVNIPFGAAVILMFFWRRLSVPAVWVSVALSAFAILVAPLATAHVTGLARHPSLVQTVEGPAGKPVPVYFKQVVRTNPDDLTSPLEGRGRFNFECYALSRLGLNPAKLSPTGRETAQFLFDGFFPFVVLILVSLFTRPPDRARIDQFYGKMKTPVGATPELELAGMEETRRAPHRFDHTKLLGANSSWEFCKWHRVDTIGFLGCCATSGTIILVFWLMLRWAAGTS
jgi:solute:Na+ symporter, SSS family